MKGSIRRRGKDARRWTLVFDASRVNGQRKQQWVKFEGTKREAEARLRELCGQVDGGQYIIGKETLGDFLDLWLERIRARVMTETGSANDREKAPNTYFTYERHVRIQIKPVLGKKVLSKLTSLDIERAIDAWRAMPNGKLADKRLSGRTVFNLYTTLDAALNKAVAWQRIKANPCRNVEPPEKGSSQISALAVDDFMGLLVALQERDLFVPCLFMALAGVRRGEALGMQRSAVDLTDGVAYIGQQVARMLDGSLGLKRPKTKRPRTVTLAPELVYALGLHLAKTKGDLVFPRPGTVSLWNPTTFSTALRDASASIGVVASSQRIRRVFSTMSNRQEGVARKAVAEIMGHSGEINLRHYDDVNLADKRSVTDSVGAAVSRLLAERGLTLEKH
jgi:integrase